VHPDIKACPPTPSRLFPVPPGREVGTDMQLSISQERLEIKVKLPLSANKKSYMPRQLVQNG